MSAAEVARAVSEAEARRDELAGEVEALSEAREERVRELGAARAAGEDTAAARRALREAELDLEEVHSALPLVASKIEELKEELTAVRRREAEATFRAVLDRQAGIVEELHDSLRKYLDVEFFPLWAEARAATAEARRREKATGGFQAHVVPENGKVWKRHGGLWALCESLDAYRQREEAS